MVDALIFTSFFLFAGLLLSFGWRPFINFIDQSIKKIYEQIKEIETHKKHSLSLLKKEKEKRLTLEQEEQDIIQRAQKEALHLKEEVVQTVEKTLFFRKTLLKQALKNSEEEISQALQNQIMDRCQENVEAFLLKKLSVEDHQLINQASLDLILQSSKS